MSLHVCFNPNLKKKGQMFKHAQKCCTTINTMNMNFDNLFIRPASVNYGCFVSPWKRRVCINTGCFSPCCQPDTNRECSEISYGCACILGSDVSSNCRMQDRQTQMCSPTPQQKLPLLQARYQNLNPYKQENIINFLFSYLTISMLFTFTPVSLFVIFSGN